MHVIRKYRIRLRFGVYLFAFLFNASKVKILDNFILRVSVTQEENLNMVNLYFDNSRERGILMRLFFPLFSSDLTLSKIMTEVVNHFATNL